MNEYAKKILLFLSFLLFSIVLVFGQHSSGYPVLVLGPRSKLINDIQERLLQETIMRSLRNKGIPVVSVMKIEETIQKKGKNALLRTDTFHLKQYCEHFNAGYVLIGSIASPKGNGDSFIAGNDLYFCRIKLYDKKNDIFHNISLELQGKENLHASFSHLADLIAKEIKEKIIN